MKLQFGRVLVIDIVNINRLSRTYFLKLYYLLFLALGDSSNRELVARKCGTAFDREATCGSSGENIGIAAKGIVR